MVTTIISIVIAYLLGSLSTAIIVCKIAGAEDPRLEGSKNPGTTNVLRLAGKRLAVITLLGDISKGVIAVLIGRLLHVHGFGLGLVALAVFLGHIYPLYFKFKGGKGVATAMGSMLALSPVLGIVVILTWLVVVAVFRYSSLAALVTGIAAPFYAHFITDPRYVLAVTIMALLLIWRHRENIVRLHEGTETKIGKSSE